MPQSTGYLFIDHRASPGLPEDVAIKCGFDPSLTREGKLYEADTLTCVHCKTALVKNPWRSRARANCPKCSNRYICDICDFHRSLPDYDHTPFEKMVDLACDAIAQGTHPRLLMP